MKTIKVEGLSKRYRIGKTRANSVRDTLAGFLRREISLEDRDLWVLNDISFDVADGETLGIIGHNGAGKSTLLKILSRITRPTKGKATIRGRVGSLLEVGTGFHSELTGRENIFLSGAILGMKRAEISSKFDEIVAFSEIEEFLDTPVKHYSSGMYMRLAFSVAAHLEPEILIVDEVLAVGDTSFQKKCLGKMQDISKGGRTVLFVSHNLHSVSRLCKKALWIEKGAIKNIGPTSEVVSDYLSKGLNFVPERSWDRPDEAPGGEHARLRSVRCLDDDGKIASTFDIRRPVMIELEYDVIKEGKQFSTTAHLYDPEGFCLFAANDVGPTWQHRQRPIGSYRSVVTIPGNLLAEGTFFVTVMGFGPITHETFFEAKDVVSFSVYDPIQGDSARGDFGGPMIGLVRPMLQWKTDYFE